MPLSYPPDWKFDGIGFGVPPEAVSECVALLARVADGSKVLLESFKSHYGDFSGSSDSLWALKDLEDAMNKTSANAAQFVDSLWSCLETATQAGLMVPTASSVNKLLMRHSIPLVVAPPILNLSSDAAVSDSAQSPKNTSPLAFALDKEIGSGGYGRVYRATRTTSVATFDYAVKILDPSPFIQDHSKALLRFAREITALRTLQHRAVVPILDAGVTADNKPYIVMPLIEGTTLIKACQSADLNGLLGYFIEICTGLEHAHQHGVIHRDLKPTNVMVRTSDDQPLVLDFGSAYILDDLDSKSLTTQAVGTVGYLPSEVVADPTFRSKLHDIYSCGIMLYESLVGVRPDPNNYKALETHRPDCKGLDDIVAGAICGVAKRTESASLVG